MKEFLLSALLILSINSLKAQIKLLNDSVETEALSQIISKPNLEEGVVKFVYDPMPEFPGGEKALYEYIQDNFNFNDSLITRGFKGKLRVNFLVSKDGPIKDIKIIKSVLPEIDTEVIRLIKDMPKWKPAQRDGMPVEMWYQIPIQICPQ